MSRPKLSPLSSLLPPKGSATKPEAIIATSLPASETAREQESIQASTLVEKQPDAEPEKPERSRARTPSFEQEAIQEHPQIPAPRTASEFNDYQDGPRSAVSFRMTERLQDRLREFAHRSRRKKQDILDEAVHLFLRGHGF